MYVLNWRGTKIETIRKFRMHQSGMGLTCLANELLSKAVDKVCFEVTLCLFLSTLFLHLIS